MKVSAWNFLVVYIFSTVHDNCLGATGHKNDPSTLSEEDEETMNNLMFGEDSYDGVHKHNPSHLSNEDEEAMNNLMFGEDSYDGVHKHDTSTLTEEDEDSMDHLMFGGDDSSEKHSKKHNPSISNKEQIKKILKKNPSTLTEEENEILEMNNLMFGGGVSREGDKEDPSTLTQEEKEFLGPGKRVYDKEDEF
mmetsp:Transcript_27833/g.28080  ORF Transcript_27833/g.28080 Transcript_27833/m.28080 type:complete len:192 (-) Transcript_27833:43-618(-)|eukprot:CAMPEP_0182424922 /NCGR_PEP_ID=MMETSP1167-20130531/11222_1 /TAXON_ID=2988 /ORGANISM="Mallomonas Sp, Strain CCMP3275" /LENGTH=191 /DNA_ID=CAMNT_0024605121 /DNA_START=118 /DNA_END=693 /DNA_ORIENTATION=-